MQNIHNDLEILKFVCEADDPDAAIKLLNCLFAAVESCEPSELTGSGLPWSSA